MISLYFGLPGCGKSTLLCKFAIDELNRIKKGRSPYKMVYSNMDLFIPDEFKPYFKKIDNSDIGVYDMSYGLILIDEGTLFADNRDYKSFSKEKISFFLLHRHYHCDILIFTQQWDGIDRKIRVITDRVYYLVKPKIFRFYTKIIPIRYAVVIPNIKDKQNGNLGEIVQGYFEPTKIEKLFCKKIVRFRYYKYFDSYEAPPLKPFPETKT